MRGCSGVCVVVPGGACVVAPRGHTWLLRGGVHGCSRGLCAWFLGGCAWLLGGGMHWIRRDTEIRSMSGRYASYWNAFLFKVHLYGTFSMNVSRNV